MSMRSRDNDGSFTADRNSFIDLLIIMSGALLSCSDDETESTDVYMQHFIFQILQERTIGIYLSKFLREQKALTPVILLE